MSAITYNTCKRIKANDIKKYGALTEQHKEQFDTLYLGGRLTEDEYKDLMDIVDEPAEEEA